ncbi:hypothetical protein N7463_007356 [Penicillium fimorum]|uniref:Serine hydrolase domain-containing protein n=1 Tax=Penicillium fimorum TaxID=1882269 RepID=A0A9W9XW55_9EURO|nr:hypothetical protein N7463_007356 [Penicillium fimorum]
MQADDKVWATGQWVGLLGFSQGAKMAASILLRQRIVNSTLNRDMPDSWRATAKGPEWRFAILLAGRSPLLSLHLGVDKVTFDIDVLRVPTVHVHGQRAT